MKNNMKPCFFFVNHKKTIILIKEKLIYEGYIDTLNLIEYLLINSFWIMKIIEKPIRFQTT